MNLQNATVNKEYYNKIKLINEPVVFMREVAFLSSRVPSIQNK